INEHQLIHKNKQLHHQYHAKSINQHLQNKNYHTIHAPHQVKLLSYRQKPQLLQLLPNQQPVVQIPIIKIKLPIQH
ncbi:hypothetical protein, partial [Staphylococcus epidermidis]|uniref:hypothetical protein n=1 Tax=Staphylococcus epidermidis TaxID=1282 RepID=UPI001C930B90